MSIQHVFPSTIQNLEDEELDAEPSTLEKFQLELVQQRADSRQVMPLVVRNLAIAQQRGMERFRFVRGGGYDKPEPKSMLGEYVLLNSSKVNTSQPSVTPPIFRMIGLKETKVVELQGSDGATITRRVSKPAHCSVPVSDPGIYL